MKLNLIVTLSLLFSSVVYADQFSTSYGDIVTIRSYAKAEWAEQPTIIQISGTNVEPGCAAQNFGNGNLNYWVIVPEDSHLLSIALMAYASGQQVKITSNDVITNRIGNACKVLYLDIKR